MEVRCCCQPTKLLGWLSVDDPARPFATFAIRRPCVELLLWRFDEDLPPITRDDPGESITLAIQKITVVDVGPASTYRALKADGIPIERLRKIPGFEEAR